MFKCKKSNCKFTRIALHGFLGAIVGILLGFVAGFVIFGMMKLVGSYSDGYVDFPIEMISFFAMGFGAVIGSVFGGVLASKE